MAKIVPTITAFTPEEYKTQLEKIKFANRIHPDFTDGKFAPSQTVNLIQAYWPEDVLADVHVMVEEPRQELETIISMDPNLAIIHVEAKGELSAIISKLKEVGISAGLAFLPESEIEPASELIQMVDHVLIFGGRLGYQGSEMQKEHLVKAEQARAINPQLELGWDGGVNDHNVREVAETGFDVINVGGYIQKADDPKAAFERLQALVS